MIGTTQLPLGMVPQFGLLYDIIAYGSEPNIVFVFILMQTLAYDPSLGAYKIEYKCLYRSSIQCYHLFNTVHVVGESDALFIKSQYDFSVYCNFFSFHC